MLRAETYMSLTLGLISLSIDIIKENIHFEKHTFEKEMILMWLLFVSFIQD